MPEFWNALDHREQALVLVTAAAILLALAIRAVRRNVPGLLTTVVSPPLGPLLFGAVVYVAAISPCWPRSASGRCRSSA
jgi:hypothetical protein